MRVTLNGYTPVKDADVYTNPSSVQGKTDAFGSVLLKGLQVGSYEIYASVNGVGSGKAAVNIKANELGEITINIIKGVDVGLAPTISLILPSIPAEFSTGENITFSADVKDDKTPAGKLSVKWESDLDGVLNESVPGSDGNIKFTTNRLSRGVHQITITARDADGYSSKASFTVSTLAPKAVTLLPANAVQGKVELEWSKYTGTDFGKYEVYRTSGDCGSSNAELIATITDIAQVKYLDDKPPFEFQVCYFVKIVNTENNERSTNEVTVSTPSGYVFPFEPGDMLKHPTKQFVYLIDRGGQKLIKFDYVALKVVQETSLQGTVGYSDIGDNGFGVEIYVPGSDGWIYVYNAENLALATSINTGLFTSSVVTTGTGIVIAAVRPSPWWEKPIRTYNRANGLHIDGNGGFDGDRLRLVPGKLETISISTGVSPTDMEYMKYDEKGNVLLHVDDKYHGDHPLNPYIFRIADNGAYSITGSEGAVYTANSSMEYRGMLQRGALEFSDFAFSDDGSVIYAATSNRKSIQIGNYPALQRTGEILTKGFPKIIVRDKKQIIALSRSSLNSSHYGIEIITIE